MVEAIRRPQHVVGRVVVQACGQGPHQGSRLGLFLILEIGARQLGLLVEDPPLQALLANLCHGCKQQLADVPVMCQPRGGQRDSDFQGTLTLADDSFAHRESLCPTFAF